MKRSPFFFGQRTTVLAVTVMKDLGVASGEGGRIADRCALDSPFYGFITGAVRRYTGDLVWSEIDEVYQLKNRRSMLLWKVARTMLDKPVEVQACDMIPEVVVGAAFPRLYPSWIQQLGFERAAEYAKDLRDVMKTVPRDAKGRWLKVQPAEGSHQ